MILSWLLLVFVFIAATNEKLTNNTSFAKSSSRLRVTGDEFVDNLTQLMMQYFPNGLPVAHLASRYKVQIFVQFIN